MPWADWYRADAWDTQWNYAVVCRSAAGILHRPTWNSGTDKLFGLTIERLTIETAQRLTLTVSFSEQHFSILPHLPRPNIEISQMRTDFSKQVDFRIWVGDRPLLRPTVKASHFGTLLTNLHRISGGSIELISTEPTNTHTQRAEGNSLSSSDEYSGWDVAGNGSIEAVFALPALAAVAAVNVSYLQRYRDAVIS